MAENDWRFMTQRNTLAMRWEDKDSIYTREGSTGGNNQGLGEDVRPVTQEEGQVT